MMTGQAVEDGEQPEPLRDGEPKAGGQCEDASQDDNSDEEAANTGTLAKSNKGARARVSRLHSRAITTHAALKAIYNPLRHTSKKVKAYEPLVAIITDLPVGGSGTVRSTIPGLEEMLPETQETILSLVNQIAKASRADAVIRAARQNASDTHAAILSELQDLVAMHKHKQAGKQGCKAVGKPARQKQQQEAAAGTETAGTAATGTATAGTAAAGTAAAKRGIAAAAAAPPTATQQRPLPPSQQKLFMVRAIFSQLKQQKDMLPGKGSFCNAGESSSKSGDWKQWRLQEDCTCSCGGSCKEAREKLNFPKDLPFVDYSSNWATANARLADCLLTWARDDLDVLLGGVISRALHERQQSFPQHEGATAAATTGGKGGGVDAAGPSTAAAGAGTSGAASSAAVSRVKTAAAALAPFAVRPTAAATARAGSAAGPATGAAAIAPAAATKETLAAAPATAAAVRATSAAVATSAAAPAAATSAAAPAAAAARAGSAAGPATGAAAIARAAAARETSAAAPAAGDGDGGGDGGGDDGDARMGSAAGPVANAAAANPGMTGSTRAAGCTQQLQEQPLKVCQKREQKEQEEKQQQQGRQQPGQLAASAAGGGQQQQHCQWQQQQPLPHKYHLEQQGPPLADSLHVLKAPRSTKHKPAAVDRLSKILGMQGSMQQQGSVCDGLTAGSNKASAAAPLHSNEGDGRALPMVDAALGYGAMLVKAGQGCSGGGKGCNEASDGPVGCRAAADDPGNGCAAAGALEGGSAAAGDAGNDRGAADAQEGGSAAADAHEGGSAATGMTGNCGAKASGVAAASTLGQAGESTTSASVPSQCSNLAAAAAAAVPSAVQQEEGNTTVAPDGNRSSKTAPETKGRVSGAGGECISTVAVCTSSAAVTVLASAPVARGLDTHDNYEDAEPVGGCIFVPGEERASRAAPPGTAVEDHGARRSERQKGKRHQQQQHGGKDDQSSCNAGAGGGKRKKSSSCTPRGKQCRSRVKEDLMSLPPLLAPAATIEDHGGLQQLAAVAGMVSSGAPVADAPAGVDHDGVAGVGSRTRRKRDVGAVIGRVEDPAVKQRKFVHWSSPLFQLRSQQPHQREEEEGERREEQQHEVSSYQSCPERQALLDVQPQPWGQQQQQTKQIKQQQQQQQQRQLRGRPQRRRQQQQQRQELSARQELAAAEERITAEARARVLIGLGSRHAAAAKAIAHLVGDAPDGASFGQLLLLLGASLTTDQLLSIAGGRGDTILLETSEIIPPTFGVPPVLRVMQVARLLACCDLSSSSDNWLDDDLVDILLFCILGGDESSYVLPGVLYTKLMGYEMDPNKKDWQRQAIRAAANATFGFSRVQRWFSEKQVKKRDGKLSLFDYSTWYCPLWIGGLHWGLVEFSSSSSSSTDTTTSGVGSSSQGSSNNRRSRQGIQSMGYGQSQQGTSDGGRCISSTDGRVDQAKGKENWGEGASTASNSSAGCNGSGTSSSGSGSGRCSKRGTEASGGSAGGSGEEPLQEGPPAAGRAMGAARPSLATAGTVYIRAYDPKGRPLEELEHLEQWLACEWEEAVRGKGRRRPAPGMVKPTCIKTVCAVTRQEDCQSCGIWVVENAWALATGVQPGMETPLHHARARAVLLVKGLVKLGQVMKENATIVLQ